MRPRKKSTSWASALPVAYSLTLAAGLLAAWCTFVAPRIPENPRETEHVRGRIWAPEEGDLPYTAPRDPAGVDLLFLGSSRIQHAICERIAEEAGMGSATVLWGQGGQLLDLLGLAQRFAARRAVVAVDPLSVHAESHPRLVEVFQELLADERGGRTATERIDERLGASVRSFVRSAVPPIRTASWHEAWFHPVDRPKAALNWLRPRLREETRAQRLENLAPIAEEMRLMREAGWEIVCVRLPLSRGVAELEDGAFAPGHLREMCAAAGVPYLDYSGEPYHTYDGHHLTIAEARRFTRALVQDLRREVGW